MKRRPAALFAALLLLFLVACAPAQVAAEQGPEFPALTGRVVDKAGLLEPRQVQALEARLERLEAETGPQFVIVTVPSLQGYPVEQFGVGLGRHWGIGHAERNDGVLLLVAPNERMVRIEVGTGLEQVLTDPFCARTIREEILPRFQQGRFPQGIEAGADAIMARLRAGRAPAEERLPA